VEQVWWKCLSGYYIGHVVIMVVGSRCVVGGKGKHTKGVRGCVSDIFIVECVFL
jgi:hypothetical protein